MIDITDTPHGLHLDTDGGTPVTLSPDTVADAPTTALDKVRGALAEHPRCDRHDGDDPVTCGWQLAVLDVQAVLDGAES